MKDFSNTVSFEALCAVDGMERHITGPTNYWGSGTTSNREHLPSAATMKSKNETRPTLDAGEFGCTPRTLYPHGMSSTFCPLCPFPMMLTTTEK